MKIRHAWLVLSSTLAIALWAALPSGAAAAEGAQPDARQVAATVQSFYDQTRDISASFEQTYVHVLYDRTDRSKGKVVFKKPGKMRWDYDKPGGKVIVGNGRRILIFEPGQEGEPDQVIEQEMSKAQLPQAMSFLTGMGRLEDEFTFRLLDGKKHGYTAGHVLELTPKEPTPHYARILFYVERNPKLRGLVRRLLIIDESGNRNRFDFKKLQFNTGVDDKTFDWQPPKSTRRVKM